MSNSIKFNKTLLASIIATSMLTACGGDDTTVEPAQVTMTPPDVIVEAEQPDIIVEAEAETATLSFNVISASSRKMLADIVVTTVVNGETTTASTDASGNAVIADLPMNASVQLMFADADGMYSTAYAQIDAADLTSGSLVSVELYNAVDSSLQLTSVTGEAVTGATLYVPGMYFGAGAPDVVATESETTPGHYSFSSLADNGVDFNIMSTGKLMTANGDVVEKVGTAQASVMAFQSTALEQISAGEDLVLYVDSVANPATFDVSFDLSINDDAFTSAPDSINVMVGSETLSATRSGSQYHIQLDAEAALSFVTVMPFMVDDVMYQVDTATISNGISSFSEGASLNVSLTANLFNEMGDEATEITHTVLSNQVVAGQSATVVIAFDQPVELSNLNATNFAFKGLKPSTSSIYAYPDRLYRYSSVPRANAVTVDCAIPGPWGTTYCGSVNNMAFNTVDNDDDTTGYIYQTDAQLAAGNTDFNAKTDALTAAQTTLDNAQTVLDEAAADAGIDSAEAVANIEAAVIARDEAAAAYTAAQYAASPEGIVEQDAQDVIDLADAVTAIATALTSYDNSVTAYDAAVLASTAADTAVTDAQTALDTLDSSATIEELAMATTAVEDAVEAAGMAEDAADDAEDAMDMAETAHLDAIQAETDLQTAIANRDVATDLETAFVAYKDSLVAFEDANRDDVFNAAEAVVMAQTAFDTATADLATADAARYSVVDFGSIDRSTRDDKLKVDKTGLFDVRSLNNKGNNKFADGQITWNNTNTVMTIELDAENILNKESENDYLAIANGEKLEFNFTVQSLSNSGLFESKTIEVVAGGSAAAQAIDSIMVVSGAGYDLADLENYDFSAGLPKARANQTNAYDLPENWITVPDRVFTDNGVDYHASFAVVNPTGLRTMCSTTDCATNPDGRLDAQYKTVNPGSNTRNFTIVTPQELTGTVEVISAKYIEQYGDGEGNHVVSEITPSTTLDVMNAYEGFLYIEDMMYNKLVPMTGSSKDYVNSFYGTDGIATGFPSDIQGAYHVYEINPLGDGSVDGHYTEVTVSFNLETANGEKIVGEKTYQLK